MSTRAHGRSLGFVLAASTVACGLGEPAVAEEARPAADTTPLDLDALQALAMINEPEPSRAQPYARRHALLERLALTSDAGRVDRRLNLALDLLQAGEASRPCAVFREALERIAASKDPYYVHAVTRARVPDVAGAGAQPDETCDGLEASRLALARSLEAPASASDEAIPGTQPVAAAEPTNANAVADPGPAAPRPEPDPRPRKRPHTGRPSVPPPKGKPNEPTTTDAPPRTVADKLDDGLKPFKDRP